MIDYNPKIPTDKQIVNLWVTYHLPQNKRIHVQCVAKVAVFLAEQCHAADPQIVIDIPLLRAAALLHDIDKEIPRQPGEHHPDTAVRILIEEGFDAVASLVKTHSLYSVLDPEISPKKWEEKLLYLADKMVKYSVITVDQRFALWRAEQLPSEALKQLRICYPLVKKIEEEIFTLIRMQPEDVCSILGL